MSAAVATLTTDDTEATLADDKKWRPWRTQRLPPLVGLKEAADIIDTTPNTLHRWLRAGSGNAESSHGPDDTYMIEPRRLDGSKRPVWVRSDVEEFAKYYGRQRAPVGETAAQKAKRLAWQADPEILQKQIARLNQMLAAAEAVRVDGDSPAPED